MRVVLDANVLVSAAISDALAPEIWDPSDAVWCISIGASWVLLGLASLTIPYAARRPSVTPPVHRN